MKVSHQFVSDFEYFALTCELPQEIFMSPFKEDDKTVFSERIKNNLACWHAKTEHEQNIIRAKFIADWLPGHASNFPKGEKFVEYITIDGWKLK